MNIFLDAALNSMIIVCNVSKITELEFFDFIQASLFNNYGLQIRTAIYIGLAGILLSTFLITRKEFKQMFLAPLRNSPKSNIKPKDDSTIPPVAKNEKTIDVASLIERIIKLTPNVVYIYDLKEKCNIYSNSSIGKLLGYSNSEIESMNQQFFGKLLHPEAEVLNLETKLYISRRSISGYSKFTKKNLIF